MAHSRSILCCGYRFGRFSMVAGVFLFIALVVSAAGRVLSQQAGERGEPVRLGESTEGQDADYEEWLETSERPENPGKPAVGGSAGPVVGTTAGLQNVLAQTAARPFQVGAAGDMIGFSHSDGTGSQTITLINTRKSWMAVYHIDRSGTIRLVSSRPLDADFTLLLNATSPLPDEIRRMSGGRQGKNQGE